MTASGTLYCPHSAHVGRSIFGYDLAPAPRSGVDPAVAPPAPSDRRPPGATQRGASALSDAGAFAEL